MDDLAPRSFQQSEHDPAIASLDQQIFDPFVIDSSFDLPSECFASLFHGELRAEHHAPSGSDTITEYLLSPFDNFHSVQAFQAESSDFLYEGTGVFPGASIHSASTIGVGSQQQPGAPIYFVPTATLTSTSPSVITGSPLRESLTVQHDRDTFSLDSSNNDPMVLFQDASSNPVPQKREREVKTTCGNTLESQQSPNPRSNQDSNDVERTSQSSVQHNGEASLESGSVFAACHLWLSTNPYQHPPKYVMSGLAFAFQVPFDKIRQWFRTQLRGVRQNASSASQSPPELPRMDPPSSVAIAACHIWLSTHFNAMPPEHVIFALSLAFASSFDSLCDWFRTQLKPCGRVRVSIDSNIILSYRTNQHKCNRNNHDDSTTYFTRDKDKPYACTSRCGRNFKTKDDWRKHEEINYPQKIWLCQLPGCAAKPHEKRVKFRKEHFKKHLELYHNGETLDENEVAKSCITIDSIFHSECLFHGCNTMLYTWKDRINHVAKHFSTQSWNSSEWRLLKGSNLVAESGAITPNLRPTSLIGGRQMTKDGLVLNGAARNADPKALLGLLQTHHASPH